MELILGARRRDRKGELVIMSGRKGRIVDSKAGKKKKDRSLNLSKRDQPSHLEKNDLIFFFSLSSWPWSPFAYHSPVNTQAEVQNLPDPLSSHLVPMRHSQLKLCLLAHCPVCADVWPSAIGNAFSCLPFWNEESGMSSSGGWQKSGCVSSPIPHTLSWGLIVEMSQKEVHKASPSPVWSWRRRLGESSLTVFTGLLHRVGSEPELLTLSESWALFHHWVTKGEGGGERAQEFDWNEFSAQSNPWRVDQWQMHVYPCRTWNPGETV